MSSKNFCADLLFLGKKAPARLFFHLSLPPTKPEANGGSGKKERKNKTDTDFRHFSFFLLSSLFSNACTSPVRSPPLLFFQE